MGEHTPGPWVCEPDFEPMGACLARTIMGPDTFVAYVLLDDEYDEVGEANARLISSAPCLLEKLEKLIEAIRFDVDKSRRLREAEDLIARVRDSET